MNGDFNFSKISMALKGLNTLKKLYDKIGSQPLSGAWCACWQNEKDNPRWYQVGTMNVKQLRQSVVGAIYSSDKSWPFQGKFKNGRLDCTYQIDQTNTGFFSLGLADDGMNENRLRGFWTGMVDIPDEFKIDKVHGLNFFASRGPSSTPKCHYREFTSEESICSR